MAIQGIFFGLDAATLATLQTAYTNAIVAVATAGQSYSISGRSFTRADLKALNETLAEIYAAQSRLAGTATTQTYPRFGGGYAT
jgi:hypothetical protein